MTATYALITGSGWEDLAEGGLGSEVETAYGLPSAPVHRLHFGNHQVLSIARHGEGHALPPHIINYRANVVALKILGATAIIALNTVGAVSSIRQPGQIAVPDQLLDYTWGREQTIYDGRRGIVDHIDFTLPFAAHVRKDILSAAESAGVDCYDGGIYATTQGPRLETAAEVDRLERNGADYVGMTAMPEAAIAREVGLDYACIALVVNKAAGRGEMPIHDDLRVSTSVARDATMSTLQAFFRKV